MQLSREGHPPLHFFSRSKFYMDSQFQEYIRPFLNKEERLRDAVSQLGLKFGPDRSEEITMLRKQVFPRIARRNNDHSLFLNHVSPACKHCNTAQGATTFILSLACNRDCFFCTNRNQHNYDTLRNTAIDVIAAFDLFAASQPKVQSVALTGGEPLLFAEQCIAFFRHVKEYENTIHTRLYTNGDLVTEEMLRKLGPWLDEIRIGVKPDENSNLALNNVENVLSLCMEYIRQVTVEMPVLPNSYTQMTVFLDNCNRLGLFNINLLEFLFPWHHADRYRRQGYRIKHRPYNVIYNYNYPGGLPVDDSETEALRCLKYAADNGFSIGVHYCSLENKLTSQIYQQNSPYKPTSTEMLSDRDHFFKSVRFFGDNAAQVKAIFREIENTRYVWDDTSHQLECHPEDLIHLMQSSINEAALTFAVVENSEEQAIMRTIHFEKIDPTDFDFTLL